MPAMCGELKEEKIEFRHATTALARELHRCILRRTLRCATLTCGPASDELRWPKGKCRRRISLVTSQEEQLLQALAERVNSTQLNEKDPDAEAFLKQSVSSNP